MSFQLNEKYGNFSLNFIWAVGGTCFLLLNALYSNLDETFDRVISELTKLK